MLIFMTAELQIRQDGVIKEHQVTVLIFTGRDFSLGVTERAKLELCFYIRRRLEPTPSGGQCPLKSKTATTGCLLTGRACRLCKPVQVWRLASIYDVGWSLRRAGIIPGNQLRSSRRKKISIPLPENYALMLINKLTNRIYPEFADFLRIRFPAFKVQKISLNAGFTCPNRDGSKGRGGCSYCNNRTFNPDYCDSRHSISRQLQEGVRFFSRKYPDMKYLAYFQAYTNTYDKIEILRLKYEEALRRKDVAGIVIATRPDCVSGDLLDYLQELSRRTFVMVEYGIESASEDTLRLVNRGHTFEEAKEAVFRTAERRIPVGAHIILGLPGETDEQMLCHADALSELPLTAVKLHQLQIIRDTAMAAEYGAFPERFRLFTVDEYIDLVAGFIDRLRADIYIDRFVSQAPKELLLAPDWGLKNHVFRALLQRRLSSMGGSKG
jgi:radical SAM protein (TIGR01212 family)